MDGRVIIGTELDTKSFEAQISELEDKLDTLSQEYETALKDADFPEDELIKYRKEIETTTNKIIDLRKKQEELSQTPGIIGNIGQSMEGVIKKVTRWGLAIFGIRSAYMMIRQAINTLASEDDAIAADIEYIRWLLAQTLKPVVEWIINTVYFLIGLLDGILSRISSISILAGKGTDAFKNMKKSTGGMSKDLANAKKQLAGFDEMNVLTDTKASGGGGGIEDAIDPSKIEKGKKQAEDLVSEWEKFGKEMEETLNLPLEAWFKSFGNWGLAVRGVTEFVHGLWEAVNGLFQFLGGVLDVIVGLITGDTEKVQKGIFNMLDGLWHVIDGLLKAVWGLIQTIVGLIIGIVGTLVDLIVEFVKWGWDTNVKILSSIGKWVYDNIIKPVADFFTGLWNGIIEGVKNAVKWVKDTFNSIVGFFRGIIDTIMGFFKTIGTNAGNAIGGAFKSVVNGVLGAIESILNFPIRSINKLIDVINKVPGINLGKLGTFSLPRLAKGGIINMPGRGVPVGNAIAGERGAEGVIPLTDSQQMELLGQSIGKYITINANITNTMNGRVISKELQKIQAENDFAYNR